MNVRKSPSVWWTIHYRHHRWCVSSSSWNPHPFMASDSTHSGGDPVGVLTPSLSGSGAPNVHAPPRLVPCCYTWPVIHGISSAGSGW